MTTYCCADPGLDLLAEVCLDTYLLARYGYLDGDLPGGRPWERVLGDLLQRPGLSNRQYAGLTTLFGSASASGCSHELDASARGWRGCLIIEGKSKKAGVSKPDIAVFDMKTFDFYCAMAPRLGDERWWRLLVSSSPISDILKKLCIAQGIIPCDGTALPLPVLLQVASRPVADQFLPEMSLAELIRLGERAAMPLQQRWVCQADGSLNYRPSRWQWKPQDLDDLLWLQRDLSGDLLDLYDLHRPGRLERRAGRLQSRLLIATKQAS